MRFIANKIIVATVSRFVQNLHHPVQDIRDLHRFFGYGSAPEGHSQKKRIPGQPGMNNASRARMAREDAQRKSFMDEMPEGLHPLVPNDYRPRSKRTPDNVASAWNYDPAVMENTYNRLKHMNPTGAEMSALSLALRGWNSASYEPGGQYLQLLSNELRGQGSHQRVTDKTNQNFWYGDDDKKAKEQKANYAMREGFRNNPMHGRLKALTAELQRQSQDEFRKQYGDDGTVLHRGISARYGEAIANRLADGKEIPTNSINSYTPSIASAHKFTNMGNDTKRLDDVWDELSAKGHVPHRDSDEMKNWSHPSTYLEYRLPHMRPLDSSKVNYRTFLSSHVKPEDVFLHNNVVGTPSGHTTANGNTSTIDKEQEAFIPHSNNIPHMVHTYNTWDLAHDAKKQTGKRSFVAPSSVTASPHFPEHLKQKTLGDFKPELEQQSYYS